MTKGCLCAYFCPFNGTNGSNNVCVDLCIAKFMISCVSCVDMPMFMC